MTCATGHLEDYQVPVIKKLRVEYNEFSHYLDYEIIEAYRAYCKLFHGAGWTEVDLKDFVDWAILPNIEYINRACNFNG